MIIPSTYLTFQSKQKQNLLIASGILLLIFATISVDFLFAQFHGGSFYISESLLFSSSFWILFLPLLFFQSWLLKKTDQLKYRVAAIGLITLIHLLLYPALVWLVSKALFNHTFAYLQTFNFGLNTYLIKAFIIYGFVFFIFVIAKKKTVFNIENQDIEERKFLSSIVVSDQHNKKTIISINDISYFSSNSPYILIHHQSKKHLHTETLKSLEKELDFNQFVRTHKSHLVNLQKVASYQSRQNGDYDLTLTDGTILRLSRNYAKDFKLKFNQFHQVSSK